MRNQKGITLVALIITIIVMVILAGVIIVSAVADGGVIDRAQAAMKQKERAEVEELIIASYVYKTGAAAGNVYAYLDLNATAGNIWKNLTNNGFVLKDGGGNELDTEDKFLDYEDKLDGTDDDNIENEIDINAKGDHGEYKGTVTEEGLGNLETIGGGKEPPENDDNVIDDFEILVEQTPNGSPVSSVTLTIRPTIPGSWKKTEFTEEEAVEIVNNGTLRIPNITNLEDFDKELYNYINDIPGVPINGETDVSDFNALKTVISSKITLGEDPENEIFSYLMSLAGLNYHTVYAAAIDIYEYQPTTYSVKVRKDSEEWKDITNESTWDYINYQVTSNGNYEIQIKLDDKNSSTKVDVIDCSNLGKYVKYDADGDDSVEDEIILWRVLRDDDNKVELITADALGTLDLTTTSFNDARSKYNGAIVSILQKCIETTGIDEVRSIGGPTIDVITDTVVFEELEFFEPNEGVSFAIYEATEEKLENGLKVGDNNYEEDFNQMQRAGVGRTDNSQEYWLASRNVYGYEEKNLVSFRSEMYI